MEGFLPASRPSKAVSVAHLGLVGALLGVLPNPAWAGTFSLFQKTYTRGTGAPITEVDTLAVRDPSTTYLLRVYNGGLVDAPTEFVSSSVIAINGATVLGPSEFNQNVQYIEEPVSLTASTTLSVEVRGKPGGLITLVIEGRDDTPPMITASVTPGPNAAGWHRIAPTVSFSCVDATSGVASVTDPITVAAEGVNQPITGTCTDVAGNSAQAQVTINLDLTAPVMSFATDPAPNAAGWHRTDPTVSFGATDALSGIDTISPPVTVTTEAGNQGITGTATDRAGNSASLTVPVSLDKTPPGVQIVAPTQGQFFAASPITVSGTASDTLSSSTVTLSGQPVTVAGEQWNTSMALAGGLNTITAVAQDAAGNQASASVLVTLDNVPPVITLDTPVDGSATNQPTLAVRGTITDNGLLASAELRCPGAADSTPLDVQAGDFTASCTRSDDGPAALTIVAVDAAGNRAEQGATVTLDRVAPAITASITPAPNAAGWHRADATVTFTCTDALSGIATCQNPVTVSTAGAGQIISGTATDRAGNSASTSMTVNLDRKPPTITAAVSPAANAVGWHRTDPTITFTCLDDLSGVAVCPPAQIVGTEGAGQTVTGTAEDAAGNAATTTVSIALDKTPPALTVTTPADGQFVASSPVTISGTVSDALSAPVVTVNSQPVSVTNGQWTGQVALAGGANTIAIVATDAAGNQTTATRTVILDHTPPVIALDAPADGLITNQSPVAVRGTVSDDGQIASIELSCAGAPQAVPAQSGAFVASCPLGGEGPKVLSLTVRDAAGNQASVERHLVYDTTPPGLTVTSPANNLLTNNPAVRVAGTLDDPTASLVVGGVSAPAAASWSADRLLSDGPHTLDIVATDPAGNASTVTRTVTIDTAPPVITLDGTDRAVTATAALTVSGGVNEAIMAITVNGVTAVVSGLRFEASVTLTEGDNLLTVVAADVAGNSATAIRTVTLDTQPPHLIITTPAPGALTNSRTIRVAGTVDDPSATVTVNGQPAPITGSAWEYTVSLAEGDNAVAIRAVDAVGNGATRALSIVVDSIPPVVQANAPADVAAGENVTLVGSADDAGGLVRLILAIGNVTVADATLADPHASRQGAYTIPVTAAVGDTVTLTVTAVDRAGNSGTATATLRVTAAATLPGFVHGEVFDDSLGLPMAGANASAAGATTSVGDNGIYLLTQSAGSVVVRVTKPGYTASERKGTVQAGRKLTLLDARLTPVDPNEVTLDAGGGVAPGASAPIRLDVPAGLFQVPTAVRVTTLSRQGLVAPLPLGWTPIAAAQIDASITTWTIPATFVVSRAVPSTAAVTVVRYDEASHQWVVVGPARWSASTLDIDLSGPGQFAMVLPDSGTVAPPAPIAGQPLAGSVSAGYPDGIAATGSVVPRAAPPSTEGPIQPAAQGTVTLTQAAGTAPLPSGMVLTAAVTERFDPRQGEVVIGPGYREDLILYRMTDDGVHGNLTATFPITPSQRYSLSELLLGTITLDIRTHEGDTPAAVVGSAGATVTTPEGAYLSIPSLALTADIPVGFTVLPAPSVPVPSEWQALAAVALDLPQTVLGSPATLTVPTPATYQPGSQLLIAQIVPIGGSQRLRLVAVGRVSGGLVTTETTVSGITLPGIRQGGEYVILRPPAPVGFISGVVRGNDQAARAGAVVDASGLPLVDQTGADGRYVVVGVVGANTVTAQDPTTAEQASAAIEISQQDAVVVRDLTLAVVPFAVTTIEPAQGATGVSIRAILRVTFNRAVDTASLTATAITLRDTASDVGVLAIASADGTQLTLYPRALVGNTTYTLTLTTGLKDRLSRPLAAAATTSFATANVIPPPRPAAGRMNVSFPDDAGMITVTATQGTVDPVYPVVLLNLATGETTSVTVLADGSFTARIFGSIGDELQLLIRDADGNQTVADLPPMRAADGRTFVGTTGGEVGGPDDSRLVIPAQALKVPAVFTLTPVSLSDPSAPSPPPPLPPSVLTIGAWRITSQGIPWRVEATFAVPKPADFPTGARPFVLKRLTLPDGTERWAMITTAKVVGNEIVTASPPFPGVTSEGTYAVVAYPAGVQTVVVSGIVFRDSNSNGVYDGGDVVAAGAYVGEGSFASLAAAPSPLAVAQADGTYALLLSAPGGSTSFTAPVTALDPRGTLSRTETLPTIDPTTTSSLAANVLLEDLVVSRQQDQAAPTLSLAAKGPELFAGTSLVNSPLTLSLTAQDDQLVASLALTQNGQVQTLAPQGLGTERTTADVTLTPLDPGLLTLVATVDDLTGKRATQRLTLRIVTASERSQLPPPIPNTPPTAVTAGISPPDGSTDLTIDTVVRIPFSEPVQATATALYLQDRATGQTVPAEIGGTGAEIILTPTGYLHYGATYDVVLTDQITDTEGKPLANPLSVSFSTMPLSVVSRTPLANGRGVSLDGTTLIGLEQTQGLVTLDVSEPGAPMALGRLDLLGQTNNGFALGQEAVVVAHKYGTQTFGTGALSLDTFDAGLAAGTFGGSSGFPVDVSSSVSASALFGLIRLVDVGTPTAPTFVKGAAITWPPNPEIEQVFGRSPGEGIPLRVAVVGPTAYVAVVPTGIQVVDLATLKTRTDRRTPIVQQTVSIGGAPRDVAAAGDLVLAVSNQGLTVLNGAAFGERLATLPLPGAFRVSAASGYRVLDPLTGAEQDKTLALVTAGSVLHVVDVTAPASPTVLGSLNLGEPLFSIIGIPGRRMAFAGNGFNTLHAIDLTDPTKPKRIGLLKGEVAPRYLAADEQTVFLSDDVVAVQYWAEGTVKFVDPTNDQQTYDGAVTDGVTRLKVRVTGQVLEGRDTVSLQLKDPAHRSTDVGLGGLCVLGTAAGQACGATRLPVPVTRPAGEPAYAEALYQVPETFVRFGSDDLKAKDEPAASRFVDVTVLDTSNMELVSRVLRLKRPPVLLVHGVWADPTTWSFLDTSLKEGGKFRTLLADYSTNNAGHFSENYGVIGEYLEQLVGDVTAQRLAGTKADIIGHSMGGLLVREYCRNESDICKRRLRKLITIDTPHKGSEAAKVVQAVRDQRAPTSLGLPDFTYDNPTCRLLIPLLHKNGMVTTGGAVDDLASGSSALQASNQERLGVPSHAVVGLTDPGIISHNRQVRGLWIGLMLFCGLRADPEMGVTADQLPVFARDVGRVVEDLITVGQTTVEVGGIMFNALRDCVGVTADSGGTFLGLVQAGIVCADSTAWAALNVPAAIVQNVRDYLTAVSQGGNIGLPTLWNEPNDRIVSRTSEQGGLASGAVHETPSVDHLTVHQSSAVASHVQQRLEEPATMAAPGSFVLEGFGP
ncbi:MAG: Ig-like domain-containing protein [Nitrospirota bacterium]